MTRAATNLESGGRHVFYQPKWRTTMKKITLGACSVAIMALMGLGANERCYGQLLNQLKRVDPTNKNSDIRKAGRDYDQHRLGINRRPADDGYTLPAFSSGPTRVHLVNNTGRTQAFRIHFKGNNRNPKANASTWKTVGVGRTVSFYFPRLSGLRKNGNRYLIWAENYDGTRWGSPSGGMSGRHWTTNERGPHDITSGTIVDQYRFQLR